MATAVEIKKLWADLDEKGRDELLNELNDAELDNLYASLNKSDKEPNALQKFDQAVYEKLPDWARGPVDTINQATSGAVEGITNIATLPQNLVRAGGQAVGIPERFLPESTASVRDRLMQTGITAPPSDSTMDRYSRRIGEELGASSLFLARMLGAASRMPQTLQAVPSMAQQATAMARANPLGVTASTAGSAVAAGTGAQTARELYPDSPMAEMVGAIGAPLAVGGLTEGVRRVLRGGQAGQQRVQETIDDFAMAGTTPTAGQAGSPSSLGIEAYLGRAPGSMRGIADKAHSQQAQIGERVSDIARSVSSKTEPSQAGRALQSGVEDFAASFKGKWRAVNSKIDPHFEPNDAIPLPATRQKLAEMAAKIKGAENVSEELINPKLAQLAVRLEEDLRATNTIPYKALKELRTSVGAKTSSTSLIADVSKGEWKALYKALNEDLTAAASAKGAEALKAVKRSDQYYKAGLSRLEGSLDKVSSKATPEQAFGYVMEGSREGATKLWAVRRSVSKEAWDDTSAVVINRLGRATPGKQNELGDVFSTERFLTNWNSLNTSAKSALIRKPETRAALDNIAKVSARIRESGAMYANPSGTGSAVGTNTAGAVAVGAALSGKFALPASILGWMTTNNIGARLFTNDRFVKWLANAGRVPPDRFPAYVARLANISADTDDPQLKKELESLQQGLSQ